MERIKALIDKLHQQAEQHADASILMDTVQILQEELRRHTAVAPGRRSTSKVAVVLPAGKFSMPAETAKEPAREARTPQVQHVAGSKEAVSEPVKEQVKEPVKEIKKEYTAEPARPAAPSWPLKETAVAKEPVKEVFALKEPVKEAPPKPVRDIAVQAAAPAPEIARNIPATAGIPSLPSGEQPGSSWSYDPVQEIPTLSHQKAFKEMNDVYGQYETSLNDKLKSEKTELASVLKEGPIKDLKKAIGVNDRFVFLGELFRGDEPMYERSIKTINNFRIFPEAEYWIERELKVKLGWDENKDVVKHFRQLVRRRFM